MTFKRHKFYSNAIESCTESDLVNRKRPDKFITNEGYTWENYAKINDFNLNPILIDHYLVSALGLHGFFFLRAIKSIEQLKFGTDINENWFSVDFEQVEEFGYIDKATALKASINLRNKGIIDVVTIKSVIYVTIFNQAVNDAIAGYYRKGYSAASDLLE